MKQKLRVYTAPLGAEASAKVPELRMQGLIYFGDDQFKKLKRKQLNIPVKLFKM